MCPSAVGVYIARSSICKEQQPSRKIPIPSFGRRCQFLLSSCRPFRCRCGARTLSCCARSKREKKLKHTPPLLWTSLSPLTRQGLLAAPPSSNSHVPNVTLHFRGFYLIFRVWRHLLVARWSGVRQVQMGCDMCPRKRSATRNAPSL